MKIYLITHAHTEQIPGVAADAWRLSPRGIEEAAALVNAPFWGEIDRIVVSSEPKTLLTVGEVVRKRSLPIWVDSRFDELRRRGWIEDYASQVRKVFAEPAVAVGGWESVDAVRERAFSGLADLQRRFRGETLALVGHGLCLSIVRATILGQATVDFSAWQRLSFATYALIEVNLPALLTDFTVSAKLER